MQFTREQLVLMQLATGGVISQTNYLTYCSVILPLAGGKTKVFPFVVEESGKSLIHLESKDGQALNMLGNVLRDKDICSLIQEETDGFVSIFLIVKKEKMEFKILLDKVPVHTPFP